MSSIIGKLLKRVGPTSQRLISQSRLCLAKSKDKSTPPKKTATRTLISEMDLITGIQKREMLAIQGGCDDPFGVEKIMKRGPGTQEAPNLVPSAFEGRLVGCVCNDNRFVQWMWLEKGCPKRCECGFWFQLEEIEPL